MGGDAYGSIARWYDTVLGPLNRPLIDLALRVQPVSEGMSVLDVGCGTGAYLEAYADAGAECYGIDLSEAMLEVAGNRLGDRADLSLGDASAMPFDADSFDLSITALFLHELDAETRASVLGEMARVTRPHGTMLVIDYWSGALRFKGRLWRGFSYCTERIAGRDHFNAWRTFIDSGGLEADVPPAVELVQTKVVAGGNLSVAVLKPAQPG